MDINKIKNNLNVRVTSMLLKNGNLNKIYELNFLLEAGLVYEYGIGIEKDFEKARHFFLEAVKRENGQAAFCLGDMYMYGKGVKEDYYEAEKWLQLASAYGILDAKILLGELYYNGYVKYQNNYQKAFQNFKQTELLEGGNIHEALGNLYLHGKGTDRDIDKAKYHYNKALKLGQKSSKYFVDIFSELNNENSEIMVINSIAEFCKEDFKDNIGAVLITSDTNIDFFGQTLYDRNSFLRILNIMNDRLKEIDLINPARTNEVEVFSQICKQTAKKLVYDHVAADISSEESIKRSYHSRCLNGAVLEGRAVCTGIIEYFRNMCACRNIDCIMIDSKDHTYCQVKLKGNWYYFDLTNVMELIKLGNPPERFLISEKTFLSGFPNFTPRASQWTYSSKEDFVINELNNTLSKLSYNKKIQVPDSIKNIQQNDTQAYYNLIIDILRGTAINDTSILSAEKNISQQEANAINLENHTQE